VSAAVLDLEGVRRRELRRTVLVSSVAHALVVAAFLVSPQIRSRPLVGPSVVTVDLVAPPPRAAPPTPAPAPPAPKPRPVARRAPSRVVLPAEPTRTVPETPEPVVPAEPTPRPEPVEESYEDLLERLRAERGEAEPEAREVVSLHPEATTPEPPPPPAPAAEVPAPAARTGPATGGGVPAPPEVVAWLRDARVHVRRSWVVPQAMRFQPLETRVEVELDATGRLLGEPEITRRSGNPWYDESVVRAIEKADPLPAPPEAGTWPFVFRPQDL